MPMYEYVCNDCSNKIEFLEGMTSKKSEPKCSKCGSKNIRRLISSFSISSKGNGSASSGPSCPIGTCSLG